MNARISRFASWLLLAATLVFGGCAMTPTTGGGYAGNYVSGYNSIGSVNRYPDGYHLRSDGNCYHGGAIMSNRRLCEDAGATMAGAGSVTTPAFRTQAAAPRIPDGITPEQAQVRLDVLLKMKSPCEGSTWLTLLGGAVGAAAGAVLNDSRGAVIVGLIGSGVANSYARFSCHEYTAEIERLQSIIAYNSCAAEVLETNGQVTSQERCRSHRQYRLENTAAQPVPRK